MKLSEKQREYYGAITWLTDPVQYRAEGRSVLLAAIFIKHAVNNPGMRIDIRDHKVYRQNNSQFMNLIRSLINEDVDIADNFIIQSDWIKYVGSGTYYKSFKGGTK